MPRKHNLPTAHLTPTEIVHHDDGTRVVMYPDYAPALAAQVPTQTPQGILLPPTYEASHVLLAGIGEPCYWEAERRREEAEAEAHLIEVLDGQGIFVGSGSYIHSIPLFTPEQYETRRMTRTLMLLPAMARSVMAATNDVLDYLVSFFGSRQCVVREWVFAGGFHVLWQPGEDAFEAGLRMQDIVRKYQCDVGRVLRDAGVIGTALIPIFRKTEVCFYRREDGAVVLSMHCHALLACKGRLASNDWFGRQTRAKKMMAKCRVPGGAGRCFPAYLHDSKLGKKGTRYVTKKPQKITRRDLGGGGGLEKPDEHHGREMALIELPDEAIAAWAVASYRTHLCESFGPMAELRSTLDGNPAHNVPARALVVERINKRRRNFFLKWRSVAPEPVDAETDHFGEDVNRDRTGRYVPCKETKAPPVHPVGWRSAHALRELPKGLGVRPQKGEDSRLSPVRLVNVSRPAASPSLKLQPRLMVISEFASLSRETLTRLQREGVRLMRSRIFKLGWMAQFENPAHKKEGEQKLWRELTDRYYGPPPVPHVYIPIHHEGSSPAPQEAGTAIAGNEPERAPP